RVHRASYEPQGGTFLGKMRFEAGRSNICYTAENVKGDVDRAFRQCVRIFEDTFTFPSVYHYAMEPYCIVAMEADHGLTVWSSAQHPYQVQRDLARLFGVPISHVRLIVPYVGGGFGSKSFTHLEPIAVALARATGRPVKLELN